MVYSTKNLSPVVNSQVFLIHLRSKSCGQSSLSHYRNHCWGGEEEGAILYSPRFCVQQPIQRMSDLSTY
jgi:hypothetical protein